LNRFGAGNIASAKLQRKPVEFLTAADKKTPKFNLPFPHPRLDALGTSRLIFKLLGVM